MIKNLPPELIDLEIYMQKLIVKVNNLEKGDPRIDELTTEIANVKEQIDTLIEAMDLLAQKQDEQKLIQITAVQRTFKDTVGNADIPASDALTGFVANSWQRRALNYSSQTKNSTDYFELVGAGSSTATIQIYKAGKYRVNYSCQFRRTNFCQSGVQYDPPSGTPIFVNEQSRTSTTATAVGATVTISGAFILDIIAGREGGYLYLNQWAQTNTSNERWGIWYTEGTASAPYNYTDTCTLSVTLIEDI